MTVHVLGDLAIDDLDQFLAVFSTEGLAKRREHGCRGTTVFSPLAGSGRVLVLLEFSRRGGIRGLPDRPDGAPAGPQRVGSEAAEDGRHLVVIEQLAGGGAAQIGHRPSVPTRPFIHADPGRHRLRHRHRRGRTNRAAPIPGPPVSRPRPGCTGAPR